MLDALVFPDKAALFAALIRPSDRVLDVGFWGQGIAPGASNWPHKLLKRQAKEVWGVDVAYDESVIAPEHRTRYQKASAESFAFAEHFDCIVVADVIEHLASPGRFLARAHEHLAEGGALIITTPNAFNLFSLAGKLARDEPAVNSDHTCYFTHRTLSVLLEKCGFAVEMRGYLYSLGCSHRESAKKKLLNALYRLLSFFTPKFCETLVVVARPMPPAPPYPLHEPPSALHT